MALAGAVLAAAASVAQAQVSLTTVVELAQKNSATVRLAQADVQKATAELQQSRDAFIPSLSFGSGLPAFREVGFTGSLPTIWDSTIQSLVFSMPQIQYIHAARAGFQSAQLALKDAREQAALDASTAYIELDTVDRELEAAREQEQDAARLVEIEQQRAEAGVDPLSTLLQAQLTAAQLKLSRLHLETRAATLSKQLAQLTGLPVGSITPDHASIPEIPAVTGDRAPAPTPGVESAQALALSRERQARGDKEHLWLLPEIGFGAAIQPQHHAPQQHRAVLCRSQQYPSRQQLQQRLFHQGSDLRHRACTPSRAKLPQRRCARGLRRNRCSSRTISRLRN